MSRNPKLHRRYGYESPLRQQRYIRECRRLWGEVAALIEGYTTADLAGYTGVDPSHISKLLSGELGTIRGPALHTVIALADAAGYTLVLRKKR